MSTPSGVHQPVVTTTTPHVDGGRLVSSPPHYRGEDWYVQTWDLSRSTEPTLDVLCGVVPDTLASDGSPLIYVYSQPDRVNQALHSGDIPTPDRVLSAASLPRSYWPETDWRRSWEHIDRVHASREEAVRNLAPGLSLVHLDPAYYFAIYP